MASRGIACRLRSRNIRVRGLHLVLWPCEMLQIGGILGRIARDDLLRDVGEAA
jgi:hypothetical protein